MGALVVRENEVVGRGYNLRETEQDPTAHAEVIALRQAASVLGSWRLERCWMIVTLEPCAMCAGAMVLSRIGGCVFGCSDPKGGFLGSLANLSDWPGLNHRFPIHGGVLSEDAGEKLKGFFRHLRDRN